MKSIWPRLFSRSFFDANTLLLRFAAVVALLSIPIKRLGHHIDTILPFNPDSTSHVISLLVGIFLLYIANQVARRKRSALALAVIGLLLLVITELLYFRNPLQTALYTAAATSLLKDRRQFVVRSDLTSLRRGLITAAGILVVIFSFSAAVFTVFDQRDFGRKLTTNESIAFTSRAVVGAPLPTHVHLHRNDRFLIAMLRTSGLLCLTVALLSLFQPLRLRRPAPHTHTAAAKQLLEKYGSSSEEFFKLWPPDKHYYFYRESFLAYKVTGGTAFILSGPVGNKEDCLHLRHEFQVFAHENGWSIALVYASSQERRHWPALQKLYIGSEAVVHTDVFTQATIRNKHFRYIKNKAVKEGLLTEVWQPPLTSAQLETLERISQQWLQQEGRREYTFAMGYFDADYLRDCRVVILKKDDQTIAYTNLIPSFSAQTASIDHMRSIPDISSVAMHYLLMETIHYSALQGAATFNLGLAPLSKLDEHAQSMNEHLLLVLKRLGQHYYSFGGLEQFKGKFAPEWRPTYLLYDGGASRLLTMSANLSSALAYRPKQKTRHHSRWIMALAAIAALAYASFPLAYFLNRPLFLQQLASSLGEAGQPYAWVFNSLDIASSIIAASIFGYLRHKHQRSSRVLRWALAAAIVASTGAFLAAVVPLPNSFVANGQWSLHLLAQPLVLIHGASSFLNSIGFVVSVVLWGIWRFRHNAKLQWTHIIVATALFCVTVGFAIGQIYPASGGLIQRLFIVDYGVWLFLLAKDLANTPRPQPNNEVS